MRGFYIGNVKIDGDLALGPMAGRLAFGPVNGMFAFGPVKGMLAFGPVNGIFALGPVNGMSTLEAAASGALGPISGRLSATGCGVFKSGTSGIFSG